MRRLSVWVVASMIAAGVGCGGSGPADRPETGSEYRDPALGVTAEIPEGWQAVREPISAITYPEQILAAASYPVDLEGAPRGSCSPRTALRQMPPDGALVQVIEYKRRALRDQQWFPPRPDPMHYSDGKFDSFECAGQSFRFAFADGGRALQGHIWFDRGRGDGDVRRQAMQVINSIELAQAPDVADGPRHGIKLASLPLEDGRMIALWAKGTPPYEGVSPCLIVIGIGEDVRQCGTVPSIFPALRASRPILPDAYAQSSPSAPLEVYGSTRSEVARVTLKYWLDDDAAKRRPARLLKANDQKTLRKAHISEPFGYFFGELPSSTSVSSVRATALNSDGEILGTADFSAVHPQHGGFRGFIAGQ